MSSSDGQRSEAFDGSSGGASRSSRDSTSVRSGQLARTASNPGDERGARDDGAGAGRAQDAGGELEVARQLAGDGRRRDARPERAPAIDAPNKRGQERLGVVDHQRDEIAPLQARLPKRTRATRKEVVPDVRVGTPRLDAVGDEGVALARTRGVVERFGQRAQSRSSSAGRAPRPGASPAPRPAPPSASRALRREESRCRTDPPARAITSRTCSESNPEIGDEIAVERRLDRTAADRP